MDDLIERVAGLTRDVVFPIWPDMDGGSLQESVSPHTDGRAWRKACGECALRTSDPQMLGNNYQQWIATGVPGHLFYCVHRDDEGKHRICACYAALHPEQALSALRDRSAP